MTYPETCEYLYHQMPMFERQGASGYKEGLSNTLALDEHFNHPHHHFATIHIGGTNGKGSVSHTIAAVLQELGYRVGLYTSPHLVDFRERIRINGEPISQDYVVDFVEKERTFFEPLHPSFFEVTTALAFKYFMDRKVDIAVIEVGLGGRLDCTNIITPLVSIITNISFDHTQFLGNTLALIAAEKAGIIKRGIPVIIGETHQETRPVFEEKANEAEAPIIFAEDKPEVVRVQPTPQGGMLYETKHWGKLTGDLGGIYQQKNLNTVLHALQVLADKGVLKNKEEKSVPKNTEDERIQHTVSSSIEQYQETVAKAIAHVAERTGLMGRWQTVRCSPQVVCDTGHNVGGWQYISKQLGQVQCHTMRIVFGMVDDKDIEGVLELLPKQAVYYFTKADSKRAMSEDTIQALAARHGLEGTAYPTVREAYESALKEAAENDFIFVGGSSYVVGDFLRTCN